LTKQEKTGQVTCKWPGASLVVVFLQRLGACVHRSQAVVVPVLRDQPLVLAPPVLLEQLEADFALELASGAAVREVILLSDNPLLLRGLVSVTAGGSGSGGSWLLLLLLRRRLLLLLLLLLLHLERRKSGWS